MTALEFVQMVEKFPCLYNSDLPEYARRDETDVAWGQVAEAMNWSITECKEKWKNIRNGFVRSLKSYPRGGAKKPYYLFDAMQFIIPFINPGILTKLRMASPQSEQTELECEFEDIKEESETMNIDIQEPQYKRIKTENGESAFDIADQNISSAQSKIQDDNSRKMFLLSLVPDVKKLTNDQLRVFRIKVLLLLEEVKSQSRRDTLEILEQYVKLLS